ncbi:jg27731 [Pararge aegeria aegeria]|uniref:Jg27731 protein n=1 Tax=Pararge aegeria aegeria TaxID=348720 RepID=A0A8S4S001_9NEOP|nr:jg27731 [Pararge aegeria aegeria]
MTFSNVKGSKICILSYHNNGVSEAGAGGRRTTGSVKGSAVGAPALTYIHFCSICSGVVKCCLSGACAKITDAGSCLATRDTWRNIKICRTNFSDEEEQDSSREMEEPLNDK